MVRVISLGDDAAGYLRPIGRLNVKQLHLAAPLNHLTSISSAVWRVRPAISNRGWLNGRFHSRSHYPTPVACYKIPPMIQLIAFDADDTLWHTEHLYREARRQFDELLRPYGFESADLETVVHDTEMRNLPY